MKAAWLLRAVRFLRGLVPVAITVLLVIVSALPWRLPAFAEVTPAFVVMAIFYWTIYRPDRLPYAATFCVGLLQDLLTGTPLGMTALILLAVQGVVGKRAGRTRRRPSALFRMVMLSASVHASSSIAAE